MKLVITLFFVAILITLLSGLYQRPSNEFVLWSTECSQQQWFNCFHPSISGGFPFAFIFDSPVTSVPNSIGIEDDIRWYPLIFNIWLYFIILFASFRLLKNHA